MATPTDVLRVAAGEIGYVALDDPDSGSKYGRWYADTMGRPEYRGPSTAYPWCAMFVSWVFAQAGQSMPGLPTPQCSVIVSRNRGSSRAVSKHDAQPGDVILFDWDPKKGNGADHVGIVELNKGSYVQTIEGNTSSGSSGSQSNGGGVWRRTRAWSDVYAVYRPEYSGEVNDMALTQEEHDALMFVYNHMQWNDKTHFSDLGNLVAAFPVTYGGGTAPLGDRLAYIDGHTHTVDEKLADIAAKVDALGVLLSKD